MPYVTFKITRDGATARQKRSIIAGVTDLLVYVLGKNPATTHVTIEEVEPENWGIGGEAVAVRRARAQASSAAPPRVPAVLTGHEEAPAGSALEALVAFYRGFNDRDLEMMEECWLPGELPSMDNPIGGIRRGFPAIRAGYERLFQGKARVRVELYDFVESHGVGLHLFVGRERGECVVDGKHLALRIRTSRLFVRHEGRWRQLHHHGSIEEPQLLAEYQTAIFGAPLEAPL